MLVVACHQPVNLVLRHPEVGIIHAKWTKDTFPEELIERLPRNDFDDRAEHVNGMPISPLCTRREGERQFRDPLAHFQQGFGRRTDLVLAIDRVRFVLHQEAVRDSRCMREQVQDCHRAVRCAGRIILAIASVENLDVRELGNEARHFMVQAQLALLEQHHRRQRRDWLGHGIDSEDRMRTDRFAFANMRGAGIILQRHLAPA